MFRAIPVNNKLCFDKELKRNWRIHEEKIRNMKSSINKFSPQHFTFLDQRAKRAALNEVRNNQIEKENQSLLTKMKFICEKGSNKSNLKADGSFEKAKTLNKPFRKRELVKIVEQNQSIVKRIYEKKSSFNVKRWEKERREIQKNINLISAFPYKDYPCTHTQVNLWMIDNDNRKTKTESLSPTKLSMVKRNCLIFNGPLKIGNSYYLVETSTENKIFKVEIENLEKVEEKYKLELKEKDALDIVERSFGGKIENLLEALVIDEEKGTCQLTCQPCNDENKQPQS